jgi:hypothetical protein
VCRVPPTQRACTLDSAPFSPQAHSHPSHGLPTPCLLNPPRRPQNVNLATAAAAVWPFPDSPIPDVVTNVLSGVSFQKLQATYYGARRVAPGAACCARLRA